MTLSNLCQCISKGNLWGVLKMVGEFSLNGIEVKFFGHASFALLGSKRIYIDPFVLPAHAEMADIIISTHDHFDHFSLEHIKKLQKADTVVVCHPKSAKKVSGNVKTIEPGHSIRVDDVNIKCVEGYNVGKPYHPKGSNNGVIIEMDGKKFYHSGDTDFIPEMKDLHQENIDVAFLPIGGKYTMDAKEAAEAAKAIKPKIAVPMHYNSGKYGGEGIEADPAEFIKALVGQGIVVKIL